MGKPTGFMEFDRELNAGKSPEERIKNFNEFHKPMPVQEREKQAARCMNCGVPFCQSGMILSGMATGCPLHNLIPEWNDELYNGNMRQALSRLLKTNNFPEFTGRVCPALCECACTCGMNGEAVTVKENEHAIIENGFEKGYIQPEIPAVRTDKKVAVIGSGPSGLAVADMLNKRGHNVTVYEKEDRIGGLLMYGIPNMKLEKSVVDRRVDIMVKEGVTFVTETDAGTFDAAKKIMSEYDAVVLCCGAGTPRDLNVPGRKDANGVYFAVDFLKENTKSLLNSGFKDKKYVDVKGKHVVIVGGGDTGNDCVGTVIRHGCKSVVQLEMMPALPKKRADSNPWPEYPRVLKTDYGQEEAIAVFGHDPRVYETTVKEMITDKNNNLKSVKIVKLSPVRDEKTGRMRMEEIPGSDEIIDADVLIIAAGFTGCSEYVAKSYGVTLNERSNVKTEPGRYAADGKVFTAGDMHRGQSLVVWAIAEGRAAAKEVDKYLMGYTNMI